MEDIKLTNIVKPVQEASILDLSGDSFGDSSILQRIINDEIDIPDSVEEELDIYKKAKNFQRLKLVSGETVDNVDKFIREHYGREGMARYKLAKHVMKILNLVPSDDVLLMLSCTSKAKVVIATAGAGKTTSLHVDLIVDKLYDKITHAYHLDPIKVEGTSVTMSPILYLNYNRHNVAPITERHLQLCTKINTLLPDASIDTDIESSTVHSFCHRWLKAFSYTVSLPEFEIANDTKRQTIWEAIIRPRWKKFYGDSDVDVSWETLNELYTYKVESLYEWDYFFETAKFVDTGLRADFTKACINKYDDMKKQMNLWDFTDYIIWTIDLLEKNEELREQIQSHYKIIVADENQDFTALMNKLLLTLYNPAKNKIIVVGDPDQTIYAFKGVSPDNVVSLMDNLEDSELLGLDTNYRCPDLIVEPAKALLDMNIMRFDKPIKTVKTGGKITVHPYSFKADQLKSAISIINKHGEANWNNTVICYRNNKSAIAIGEELYYAGIPLRVLDDRRPFNNLVFNQIKTALYALYTLDDTEANKTLYRFLPLSKEQWYAIVESNAKMRRRHLMDFMYPAALPKGTEEAITALIMAANSIRERPCSDYMNVILSLYRKYYFDFIKKNPNPTIGDEDYYNHLLERTAIFWRRPCTYEYLIAELSERNIEKPNSVTLSTFHGLKGLEFDYVIVLDFNESIFPNSAEISIRYTKNTAMEELESETRLCYVLVTRAIKHLYLHYSENDPSLYVNVIMKAYNNENKEVPEQPQAVKLDLSAPVPTDIASSKLSFINRMTRGRG